MMTKEEQQNLQIVQSILGEYAKLGKSAKGGDVPLPASEYLADDVEWVISGSIDDPGTGRFLGRKKVEEVFARFNAQVAGQQHNPREYIVQDDKVVVVGSCQVCFKLNNRSVESSFFYKYTLRDGKIVLFHAMYGYP